MAWYRLTQSHSLACLHIVLSVVLMKVGPFEDFYVGNCLGQYGILPHDTRERQRAEDGSESMADRFNLFNPACLASYRPNTTDLNDWFADYAANAGAPAVGREAGVSPHAISFHYVKGDLMSRMHAVLYGLCD